MEKPFYKKWWFILIAALIVIYGLSALTLLMDDETEAETEQPSTVVDEPVDNESDKELTFEEKAIANAEEHPATAGKILYGVDYKGMAYFFEGEVIGYLIVEGNNSALVKNKDGYVMPMNLYVHEPEVGETIKVYGNLSGDGYANKDLGVDNVVGMTGYINISLIEYVD